MKTLYLLVSFCLIFGLSHGQEEDKNDAEEQMPQDRQQPLVSRFPFEGRYGTPTPQTNGLGAGGSLGGGFGAERSTGLWQPFNGRSFLFVSNSITWAQAQQNCLAMGGNLATVHNKPEDEFVQDIAEGRKAWIGFSNAQEDRYWFWINSDPLSYTNWCPGQPDNQWWNQKCGTINFRGRRCWDDENCSKKFPYVCERKEEGN